MKILLLKEQTRRFLRTFFFTTATHHITARTLTKLILSSIKLYPVALAAQLAGMIALVATFWASEVNEYFLIFWFVCGLVSIWYALRFVRNFWRDQEKVAHIRHWVRRWTILAVASGIIWGVGGPVLFMSLSGISQVVTVAVVVAVTFASWPVYSCWMPSLFAFTVLSVAPVSIVVASQYGISQGLIATVILLSLIFILYSGKKLNDLIVSAILTDSQNQRLVERLRVEITRAENARRKLQTESERRAKFFAAANHDIRQPLQAMGIYLDILKRRSTPQTAPVIEQLSVTSAAISTLVEQVLTVTRMEFGQMELHPEHVNVRELLTDLGEECRAIAEKKGLTIRVNSVSETILTDVTMVKRALKNLISNAIAYSDPSAPKPEIVLGARRVGTNRLSIGIYDCGRGIPKTERDRVFSTFYRGDAGREKPGSGYGLGLSIVRGIARQLGIEVTVGSIAGRGSVFRLLFNIAEVEQAEKLETKKEALPEIVPISGTIALLEDNRFVREAIENMLTSWGATVVSSGEPDENFMQRVAEAGDVRALVSDYNLGEELPTGLEAAGILEEKLGHRLPMVLLTAVAADLIESDFRRGKLSGKTLPEAMPRILQKPADAATLNEAIWRAMLAGEN